MKLPENLLLDFGGVIIPINPAKTEEAFTSLWVKNPPTKKVLDNFEKGKLSAEEFTSEWKGAKWMMSSDVRTAWNALLGEIPADRIKWLKKKAKNHKLYLVSNTNEIHIEAIKASMGRFEWNQFISIFEKVYFSYEVGKRKPEKGYFEHVLKDANLQAEDCLFVDDTLEHIQAASKLNIPGCHLTEDESILDLDKAL